MGDNKIVIGGNATNVIANIGGNVNVGGQQTVQSNEEIGRLVEQLLTVISQNGGGVAEEQIKSLQSEIASGNKTGIVTKVREVLATCSHLKGTGDLLIQLTPVLAQFSTLLGTTFPF